jgi:outer membrane protein
MARVTVVLAVIAAVGVVAPAIAQTVAPTLPASTSQAGGPPLTLDDAIKRALAGHPRLRAARDLADAAHATTIEAASPRFPTITGALTGVTALDNSRIAAGGLNNPIIFDRYSNGVAVGQLVTDFGRTGAFIDSASLRADARNRDVTEQAAEVRLQVTAAFFGLLRAQAVLRVADAAVQTRQAVVDQVAELARNQLKSQLDVSLVSVDLGRAQLLQTEARNEVAVRRADLDDAMGLDQPEAYTLVDPATGQPTAPPVLAPLLSAALAARPDLQSLRLDHDAAQRFADGQGRLSWPTVQFGAAAGLTPWHQNTLTDRYAAAGVNVAIPIFNGRLFSAQHAEAQARADGEAELVRDAEHRASHDIEVAWAQAAGAFDRLDLTTRIVAEASQAQSLAQSRYDLGLSSVIELSQAQLAATEAQIADVSARYEYETALARLRFELGQ